MPANSGAFDLDYEIGVSAKRSDNINLSETDPVSDTVISPQLHFEIEEEGPRVQLAARGDTEYLHYTSDTFDEEVRGTFAGRLNWSVIPNRMDFVLQDYLSRQPVDELEPLTPTNQQQANVFVAGPSFHARFNAATRGQLDLRYTNSYAEENDAFNGDRFDVTARWLRELSPTRTFSINLHGVRAEFDEAGVVAGGISPDYTGYDGYFGYTADGVNVDSDIDLGYSRLDPEGGGPEESTPLVRANFDWHVSPRSTFSVTARNQLIDATQSLIEASQEFDRRYFNELRYLDVSIKPQPYRERMARLRYRFSGPRTTLNLAPYHRRVRYIDDFVQDEDRRGVLLQVDHRLKPRLTLSVLAAREDRDYVDLDRNDKDLAISVGLENRFTRHWTGRIELQRLERDSTATGRSYDANAVVLTVSYRR